MSRIFLGRMFKAEFFSHGLYWYQTIGDIFKNIARVYCGRGINFSVSLIVPNAFIEVITRNQISAFKPLF